MRSPGIRGKVQQRQQCIAVITCKLHLSFAVDHNSLFLRLLLLALVLSNAVEEVLTATRVLYVLNTDVDSFGQDAAPANTTASSDKTTPPTRQVLVVPRTRRTNTIFC